MYEFNIQLNQKKKQIKIMIQTQSRPLYIQKQLRKQLFDDIDYAWQLLQCQVKLQTSDDVTGEDVSHLLQLYMKGVQKMNSFLDIRQSFFKQRVVTLMSRPTVMKTINSNKNIMSKKNIAPVATTQKATNQINGNQKKNISPTRLQNKAEMLHLKQKRRQIQLRLAYGTEQNSPDVLSKMIQVQAQKQTLITSKISQIVENHQQKLMKRIKQRKLKTLAAKSLSNVMINHNQTEGSQQEIHFNQKQKRQAKLQQQFGSCILLDQYSQTRSQNPKSKRRFKSLSPPRSKKMPIQAGSPLRRTISYNMAVHVSNQHIKMWNFQGIST